MTMPGLLGPHMEPQGEAARPGASPVPVVSAAWGRSVWLVSPCHREGQGDNRSPHREPAVAEYPDRRPDPRTGSITSFLWDLSFSIALWNLERGLLRRLTFLNWKFKFPHVHLDHRTRDTESADSDIRSLGHSGDQSVLRFWLLCGGCTNAHLHSTVCLGYFSHTTSTCCF